MTPLVRYTLLQVPGWLLLGILLWWGVRADWISITIAVWIMGLWLLKDAVLYPVCRKAFVKEPARETEKLIGREAETVNTLAPEGQVRIAGELWTARSKDGGEIGNGRRIRVTAVEGLILIVEPV